MATGPFLIGIDYGTESCRVGIFTPDGTPVTFASRTHRLTHPRPGWAEQDPDQWWAGLVAATRQALDTSGVAPDAIVGIAVDATAATVLAVDRAGRHLRPAIMWMDVRASAEAERIAATGHPALKYNGHGAVSAEWGLPKAMWLRANEPEIYHDAVHIVDASDWVVHRLTGQWAASITNAAAKWYHDRHEGGYPEQLFDEVGVPDLLDKLPGRVVDNTHVSGGLTGAVADELGLRRGTPVAQGALDAYTGALGLGVVHPGRLAITTGSSHAMVGQAAAPLHAPGLWGAYTDALIPGQYSVEAGQASTGSVVAWFKHHFAGGVAAAAAQRGVDTYVVLDELAAQVPIGCEGLIVGNWFQGNRSPYADPDARGMFWGLTLSHGPGHLFRAILESVCYGTEHIFRTMRAAGFAPAETRVAGGPTNSLLWMQMHADVTNTPLLITRGGDVAPVLGAAMLAAVGAGVHPDLQTAAQHMVHVARTIEPDAVAHEHYAFYFDKYVRSYEQMRELMIETVRHVAHGG